MSNSTIDFALDTSVQSEAYNLSSSQTNYSVITDLNGGNYSGGLITWSNINLQSSNSGSVYDLKNALYHIPMTYKLSITGGTFTSDGTTPYPDNINAVTKKGNHHFFHNAWCKLGGVNLNTNTGQGYLNMYINEKKKEKSLIDTISDDMDQTYFDSADSYDYVFQSTGTAQYVGEINNASERVLADGTNTLYPVANLNSAIYQRNGHFWDINASNRVNSLINTASFDSTFQPYFTNGATTMQWNDVLVGKLSDINEVFDKCPPVFHLNGFEVKLQMNAGSSVSYTITYVANANNNTAINNGTVKLFTPASFGTNNGGIVVGNGQTCPLMVSSASATGLAGLTMLQTAANAAIQLTLTCTIGWSGNTAPCRLLIPQHKLDASSLTKFTNSPIFRFYAKNFYLDQSLSGIAGNSVVNRTLPAQYKRCRKLYIVPFLSNQMVTNGYNMVVPYQSPISSCPNTSSICRLRNFNILLGGESLFPQEPLYGPTMFYDENYYLLNSKEFSFDNSPSNPLKSGRIKKSDWIGCYNTYIVDLKHCLADEDDQVDKALAINFIVDAPSSIKYDFFFFVECEQRFDMDSINGTLLQA